MNYYNEFDKFAAEWLRCLIDAKAIPLGYVDTRSIEDVTPNDLKGFTQHHFFAGIGGWPEALCIAGWPDDKPVWTGSCPCQPFSAAGKGDGFTDERHLWPAWDYLIGQHQPGVIFGEQVETAINHGWFDLVCADLEGKGYTIGAHGIPAACVGAPHIRQRLWFVADSASGGKESAQQSGQRNGMFSGGTVGGVGQPNSAGCEPGWFTSASTRYGGSVEPTGSGHGVAHGAGDANAEGLEIIGEQQTRRQCATVERTGSIADPYVEFEWLACRDGKYRPTQPGIFPLAHGVPARMGRLRGFGNAINPWVAAEFIKAYMIDRGIMK